METILFKEKIKPSHDYEPCSNGPNNMSLIKQLRVDFICLAIPCQFAIQVYMFIAFTIIERIRQLFTC